MRALKTALFWAVTLLTAGTMTTSCTDYQDEIDALDYRVTVLESLVKQVNNNLEVMMITVNAMENGDFITAVRETDDGYLLNFNQAGPIHIIDGRDGRDGKDAQAPDISVEQDPTDGEWYWVINGEWLLVGGEKIRANGHDGRDGTDGKDAVSPQVRINPETGIWEISADGGKTWTSTGTSATGAPGRDGKDGKDGEDGKNGENGRDGNQFFMTVNYTIDTDLTEYMIITTRSGQTFKIPIYSSNQ